jgi:hypothetical protein
MLGREVLDVKENIASYRQLSTYQPVALFDIYEGLRRSWLALGISVMRKDFENRK